MIIYSIYRCVNKINGKVYIGFDSKWPNRIKKHKYNKSNTKLHFAIRKYGWDNFEWNVIYQSTDAKHTLNVMEPFFIKEHNSFYDGYNMTFGGEGTLGYWTEETKKLYLHSQKNISKKKLSIETKEKISKALFGKKHTEERNLAKSKRMTGVPQPKNCGKRDTKRKDFGVPRPHIQGKKQTMIKCPYCEKEGGISIMNRWHFINCKSYSSSTTNISSDD